MGFFDKRMLKKYSKEAKHLSESIAICIGDYGLYDANRKLIATWEETKEALDLSLDEEGTLSIEDYDALMENIVYKL